VDIRRMKVLNTFVAMRVTTSWTILVGCLFRPVFVSLVFNRLCMIGRKKKKFRGKMKLKSGVITVTLICCDLLRIVENC
jgi:hypothetical protein